MINLFLNIYFEQNESRRKELEICIENNIKAGFYHIYLFAEEKDKEYALGWLEKYKGIQDIIVVICKQRPAFQDYINFANSLPNAETSLNCVFNLDIFIKSDDLEKLKQLPRRQKLFIALSRWDITNEGEFLLDRKDSQDAFIWQGICSVNNAWCFLGSCGFDNSICYKFDSSGYKVINPSRDIKIFHLHQVGINNYRDDQGNIKGDHVCPEPYYFVPPIFINQI